MGEESVLCGIFGEYCCWVWYRTFFQTFLSFSCHPVKSCGEVRKKALTTRHELLIYFNGNLYIKLEERHYLFESVKFLALSYLFPSFHRVLCTRIFPVKPKRRALTSNILSGGSRPSPHPPSGHQPFLLQAKSNTAPTRDPKPCRQTLHQDGKLPRHWRSNPVGMRL